jgi:hypothetical protein
MVRPKPFRETPIERIYREVTGGKMPRAVRLILLPRRSVCEHSTRPPRTKQA